MGTPASFFSTILLVTAAIGGGVALLDFLLSDNQKTWLSNATLMLWNWVDEIKRYPLFKRLMTPPWQKIIMILSFCIASLVLFYIFHSVMSNIWIMLFAIAVFCSAAYLDYKVFPYVVSKFLTSRNLLFFIYKSLAVWFISGLIGSVLFNDVLPFMYNFITKMEIPDYSFVRYPAMVIAVIALFVIAVLSFLFFLICFQTALIYMCAVLIWLWFGFVYLVIYPTELIIRRIAEYPTGPLLGISALVGGIGLLVQAFM